jgi:Cu+-exporting ATPase
MDDMQMELNDQPGSVESTARIKVAEAKIERRIDPVCGMEADPRGKFQYTYGGSSFYFCSEEDMQTFKKDPEKFAVPHAQQ